MARADRVTASYGPTGDICTVLIPGWPNAPRIVAREDGRDEISVTASKCHPAEEWRLVRLRRGVLSTISYLTRSAPEGRPRRTVYDAVVRVPPHRLSAIRVVTERGAQRGN